MINFASNLNKMINAGLGGPLDPPRTEVAVGHRVIYTEVSGAVASFETNVIAPVKNLRVTMEPVQAGSGDPSPENIRPITGRDSVTVTRTGINVWDEEWVNGFINDSGVFTARNDIVGTKNTIPVRPNTTYRFVRSVQGFVTYWKKGHAYNALVASDFISRVSLAASVTTFTTPEDCYAVHFNLAAAYGSSYGHDVSVNYPSTDTEYHASEGIATATIQLGTTVYGGTVDVTGGSAESEWSLVDLGTLNWTYYSTKLVFYASSPIPRKKYGFTNIICTAYKSRTALTGNNWNLQDKEIGGGNTSYYIYIKDLSYTDSETFKASLRGVMACYEMDMPTEITTIPAQLSTLAGENNVWSDAGDISLEYPYYEETEGY